MDNSRLIASDLSYQVLQRRRGLNELVTPPLDEGNRRRYGRRPARDFLPAEDRADRAHSNPPTVATGEQD